MVAASSLLLLFVWSVCHPILANGRVFSDEDTDADDDWPVLCPPDTFYSLEKDQCVTCSECPVNKIIISQCHGLHDTKCGPLYAFHGSLSSDPKAAAAEDKFQKDTRVSSHESGKQPNKTKTDGHSNNRLHSSSDYSSSDSEWKSLTIALIVLVSVVFILVVSFVSYFLRKTLMNKTKIVYEYSIPPENV